MAEASAIEWTRSTFNPWVGCTKVGPGCDHCYAEHQSRRLAVKWGAGEPRRRTSVSYWKQPLAWNRQAHESAERWPVFCASLADVFDNEVPEEWRADLWELILATPNLTWQIVTKRIGNAPRMLPAGWGDGYSNVWLLSTIVDQEEADRDIPKLLSIPARLHGISYELALGPVSWFGLPDHGLRSRTDSNWKQAAALRWIIVGGESKQPGAPARPFDIAWARSTVAQCREVGVACFVKQLGSRAIVRGTEGSHDVHRYDAGLHHPKGGEPAEWPADLRVREFPNV